MTTRSIVQFSPQTMQSYYLKDGFTAWRQSQKEDFLPVIYY